jgi:hypothetical protein
VHIKEAWRKIPIVGQEEGENAANPDENRIPELSTQNTVRKGNGKGGG